MNLVQISAAGENFANSQARSTRNVNGFTVKYTRFLVIRAQEVAFLFNVRVWSGRLRARAGR